MEVVLVEVQCPHCWQRFEVQVDTSQGDQEYVEDCQVCCRPLLLAVTLAVSAAPTVTVRPENE